jgi:hypothetical protein
MAITLLFAFLTVAGLANGRNFNFFNNLKYTVVVGIQSSSEMEQPGKGGFILQPLDAVSNGLES